MIKEQSFDTNISINSDEEIKQIEIHPFYTHFYYSNNSNTQINTQNERVNQPAPPLEYKFMGTCYNNDESVQSQSIQIIQKKSKLQDQLNSQYIINVSKSVDIYLDNKRHQNNYKVEAGSMQLIKMNMLKNKNAVNNYNTHQKKSRNYKNATSNVRNKSPLSILKKSSCEGSLSKNSENLQYQLISNKKVSFEFTKEQIKSMKRINVSNVLIKQRTKFFFN